MTTKTEFVLLESEVSRGCDAVECPKCQGFAAEVDSTPEEIADNSLNCGRNYACCCIAFVCRKCGTRIVGRKEAPEMDMS